MASISAKECGVCHEEYDEDSRCPRTFTCSHTLCTACISQLLKTGKKQCPFCRKHIRANDVNSVMVNHAAVDLIKHIYYLELLTVEHPTCPPTPREDRIKELKMKSKATIDYLVYASGLALEQNEKAIDDLDHLQTEVTQENTKIETDVLAQIQNIISQNHKMTLELDNTNTILHSHVKEIKETVKRLENMSEGLASCTSNTYKDSAVLLDNAEESIQDIMHWIHDIRQTISEEESKLHKTGSAFKRRSEKINVIAEILNPPSESAEEIDLVQSMAGIDIMEDNLILGCVTPENLRELGGAVKHMVKQGRVFAFQPDRRRGKYAKISVTDDNKLCLHHLKFERPPPYVHIIDHGDIMGLVDPTARLVFFELSANGTMLGRIYIRLNADSKGARHFTLLCTGQKGPSYANTNILEVHCKGLEGEYVSCGDYEGLNGRGGKGLLEGIADETGDEYWARRLAGTVEGRWRDGNEVAAQFDINTREKADAMCYYPSIGHVEEGLQVLADAIYRYREITEVKFSDCGIVFCS